jgi:hypothetical protein
MNERIEKLVIEAFFDESTNGADQKMYTLGEEKIQKFAELIVRECVFISRTSADGFSAGRRMAERFGVEE